MTAMDIIREVAEAHGVTPDMLRSREHPYRLCEARRTVYRRLHDERQLSLTQIGRIMGGRHHTVILTGISDARKERNRISFRKYYLANRAPVKPRKPAKGYSYCKDKRRWQAYIPRGSSKISLGYFDTAEAARAAYVAARAKFDEASSPRAATVA